MPARTDSDGQPHEGFNADLRNRRSAAELIGLARGIMADGTLKAVEIEDLINWFETNPRAEHSFPGNMLLARLKRYTRDKYIDDDELADLASALESISGVNKKLNAPVATTLPLNDPPPIVEFAGMEFVFTGKFFYGPRRICEQAITYMGGTCHNAPRGSTDYLVIGTLGSRDWITSSYGTKIEAAVRMRRKGCGIAIISEDHWAAHV